jgi:acyl-CoA hydrolase
VTGVGAAFAVVVTEFGAAELKGQTLAERSRRPVVVAHPDFRDELDRAAHDIQQRGFLDAVASLAAPGLPVRR